MKLPTIHTNGTSATELTQSYSDAFIAVRAAARVVAEKGPNGRDYYPQGGDACSIAMEEHRSRLNRLEQIAMELEEIAEHCSNFIK